MTTLRRVAFLALGLTADVLYTVALAIQPRPLRKPEQAKAKPSVADRFPTALRVRDEPSTPKWCGAGRGWTCLNYATRDDDGMCDICRLRALAEMRRTERGRAAFDDIEQAELDAMRETIRYARRDADWCIAARPTDSEGVARAQRVIEWADGRIREIEQTQEPEHGARDGSGWLSKGGAA